MDLQTKKPRWLRVKLPSGENYYSTVRLLKRLNLHTICQEAYCPNIAECFGARTAAFMILGDVCTRNCRYCNVKHGLPSGVDLGEPARIARAVSELGLHYVVVTSVTRDDLEDGGAGIFAETVSEIKHENPECKVEVLIPDFQGDREALQTIIKSCPDVVNHNIEVVKRLFPQTRPQGDYGRSLELLKRSKEGGMTTKSGFMVGLGESRDEIMETMEDLYDVADILTIGQYLQPSKSHMIVSKYYTPEEFKELEARGYWMGFKRVEAGPLVRSSYHAKEYGI